MLYDKKEYKRDAASIRGYLQITPIEGLSYKMSLNIDYDSKFTHNLGLLDNARFTNIKEITTALLDKRNQG